jgi:hypothetical protein
MSFGLTILTLVHVALSLVGIGFVVAYNFLAAKRRDVWTAIFLSTTVLTSVAGADTVGVPICADPVRRSGDFRSSCHGRGDPVSHSTSSHGLSRR